MLCKMRAMLLLFSFTVLLFFHCSAEYLRSGKEHSHNTRKRTLKAPNYIVNGDMNIDEKALLLEKAVEMRKHYSTDEVLSQLPQLQGMVFFFSFTIFVTLITEIYKKKFNNMESTIHNPKNLPLNEILDIAFVFEACSPEPQTIFERWRNVVEGYNCIIIGKV